MYMHVGATAVHHDAYHTVGSHLFVDNIAIATGRVRPDTSLLATGAHSLFVRSRQVWLRLARTLESVEPTLQTTTPEDN